MRVLQLYSYNCVKCCITQLLECAEQDKTIGFLKTVTDIDWISVVLKHIFVV